VNSTSRTEGSDGLRAFDDGVQCMHGGMTAEIPGIAALIWSTSVDDVGARLLEHTDDGRLCTRQRGDRSRPSVPPPQEPTVATRIGPRCDRR